MNPVTEDTPACRGACSCACGYGRPPSIWREHIWSRTAGLSAVLWLELSRCGLSTEEPQFSDMGVIRKKKTAPPQPENVLLGPNSLEKLQRLWDEGVLGF